MQSIQLDGGKDFNSLEELGARRRTFGRKSFGDLLNFANYNRIFSPRWRPLLCLRHRSDFPWKVPSNASRRAQSVFFSKGLHHQSAMPTERDTYCWRQGLRKKALSSWRASFDKKKVRQILFRTARSTKTSFRKKKLIHVLMGLEIIRRSWPFLSCNYSNSELFAFPIENVIQVKS